MVYFGLLFDANLDDDAMNHVTIIKKVAEIEHIWIKMCIFAGDNRLIIHSEKLNSEKEYVKY